MTQSMALTPPNQIPGLSKSQPWVIRTILKGRYRCGIAPPLVAAGVGISPASRELSACLVSVWQSRDGYAFASPKADERAYRRQFFFDPVTQMARGRSEYDDLTTCAVAPFEAPSGDAAEEGGRPGR